MKPSWMLDVAGVALIALGAMFVLLVANGILLMWTLRNRTPDLWERLGEPKYISWGLGARKIPWGFLRFVYLEPMRGVDARIGRLVRRGRALAAGCVLAWISIFAFVFASGLRESDWR